MRKIAAMLIALVMLVQSACAEDIWSVSETPELTAEVSAMIESAAGQLFAADYTALACAAEKTDGGISRLILFEITALGPDVPPTLALITLNAEGRITSISFTENGFSLEGWALPGSVLPTEEAKTALFTATDGIYGADFHCIALLAERNEGASLLMLCAVTPDIEGAFPEYMLAEICTDSYGYTELADLMGFE